MIAFGKLLRRGYGGYHNLIAIHVDEGNWFIYLNTKIAS